ncbi:Hypothetical predicted protein [Cloeon dipterum]|uniref:Protein SHQ1 homolog n=1 Tax=Cloeon dipterum TaxID=197152 RepID=A0A8S1E5A9_9INSE|nr:Hypothetical predicted protein [Cloeon dipterum]
MITPRYQVEQTEESLVFRIHAPYTDVNESDIHVDGNSVCFTASPFYLRLHLSGPVIEDDKSEAHFDVDSGDYVVTLSKCNKGQHFENLKMTNILLQPPSGKAIPKIEVLGETNVSQDLKDFDWYIDQDIEEESLDDSLLLPHYGFAHQKCGVLRHMEADLPELMDLQSPDDTPSSEREKLQETWENKHFCPEHYLADWAEEEELILPLLEDTKSLVPKSDEFIASEQEQLLRLPKLEILQLTQDEQKSALLGLAEIVFCWAHEQITTQGDLSFESARSIRRLSATFSWLRKFTSVQKFALSCMRRALCIPLYRNWKLANAAMELTITVLKNGRIAVIKCLLELMKNFANCEGYHIHRQLYLEPYSLWTQTLSDEVLSKLADSLARHNPKKGDIGWDLEELETAGRITLEEENALDNLTKQLKTSLNVRCVEEDSDDTDDDSEWETDSEDSSESSEEEPTESSMSETKVL